MAALLQDLRIEEFDILAIQEPWRNPIDSTTYNPRSSCFHIVDKKEENPRVVIYVNKRISINSWDAHFTSSDLCILHLRLSYGTQASRSIYVHNVYNPPPASHTEERDLGTLIALKEATAVQREQIILGDFNLYRSARRQVNRYSTTADN
jgi:hypothetical protein